MRSDEAVVKIYIWDILRTHFELWSCVELSVEDDPADPPEGDQDEVVAEVEDGQHGEDAQPEPEYSRILG